MKIHKNVDLSTSNTLQLRSSAEYLAEPQSLEEVKTLLADTNLKQLRWSVLGGGSNLVLPAAVQGLVLKVANKGRELIREDNDFWYVKGAAGEVWHEFVQWTVQMGYCGLENLSLIPGTVGAAPIQNIGAYGVEVKDSIWEVHCINLETGESEFFSTQDCCFNYRDSFFKQEGSGRYLVWDVTFRLPKNQTLHLEYGDIKKELEKLALTPNPQNIAKAVIHIRQTKLPDPQVIGNAGSFFKNPVVSKKQRDQLLLKHIDLISYAYGDNHYKLAAGWLIDRAGWKGKRLGPVGMYEKQALVLVNHGGASAEDVWKLAEQVAKDVKATFGVDIEPEPVRW